MKKLPSEFGLGNLNARRFWIDPSGNFYGVPHGWNHPMWADKYLTLKGIHSNYPEGELYKLGWVRVIDMLQKLSYEHRHVPLNSK